MNIWQFLAICVAVAISIRFFLIPRLARTLPQLTGPAAARRCGFLAMLGFIASAAQVAAASGAAVVLLVWWLARAGGTTATQITAAMTLIESWRHNVEEMTFFSSGFFLIVTVFGFALYFRKRGQIHAKKAIGRAAEREFDRLKELLFKGELPPLPPTPDMQRIDEELAKMQEGYNSMAAASAQNEPQAVEFQKKLETDASNLLAYRARADIMRRIPFKLDAEDAALPRPRTFWEKVEVALMSRGLLMNASRVRRALGYVALALMVPAFFSFNAQLTAPTLERRSEKLAQQKIKFEEIEIKLQREKDLAEARKAAETAEQAWQQAVQSASQTIADPLTAADAENANILAAKFEYETAAKGVWHEAGADTGNVYELRSLSTRDQILESAAAQRPERLAAAAATVDSELTGPEKETLRSIGDESAPIRARTHRGTDFAEKLKTVLAHGGTDLRARARVEAAAWRETARASDFQRAILGHFTELFVDGISPPLGQVAVSITDDQREAFQLFDRATTNRAATNWIHGADVKEATGLALETGDRVISPGELAELQRIVRTGAEQIPSAGNLTVKFRNSPPALRTVENRQAITRAAEALEEFRTKHPDEARQYASMGDAVEVYDDYFPGQVGADQHTATSEIRRSFEEGKPLHPSDLQQFAIADGGGNGPSGGGAGGGGGFGGRSAASEPRGAGIGESRVPRTQVPRMGPSAGTDIHLPRTSTGGLTNALRTSFTRARSFGMLRGFSRVGGVLIGREPEDKANLDLRDLSWDISRDGHIVLAVTDSVGKGTRSVPMRAKVLYQALVYAADERPTAVTMAKADPLYELKILAHPALVDTTLGGYVIDLDRFVDKYTGEKDGFRDKAQHTVQAENELYKIAWATRLLSLRSSSTASINELDKFFRVAQAVLDHAPGSNASAILGTEFAATDRSPLAVKTEFYDLKLVKLIQDVTPQSHTLSEFCEHISKAIEARALLLRNVFDQNSAIARRATADDEDEVREWLALPPKFEFWSGVREMPYENSFEAIFPSETGSARAALDFMLQVAFTSDPHFGPNRIRRDEDSGSYSDNLPWEFPGLKQRIRETVQMSLETEEKLILSAATEFTRAQRFFRLAFLGRLGPEFPVAKLSQLAKDLQAVVKPELWITPRWNSRPGTLEKAAADVLLQVLDSHDQQPAPEVEETLKKCADLAIANVKRRQAFQDELRRLLSGSDRSTKVPREKWQAAWEHEEKAQVGWESSWTKLSEQLAKSAEHTSLSSSVQQAVEFVSLTATALKVRRALEVSVDDRLMVETRFGLREPPPL